MSRAIKRFDWKTLEDYFDKTNLSESSKTSTETKIRHVLANVFGKKEYSIAELKSSGPKVCEFIMSDHVRHYTSKKTYMFAMRHLYKALNVKHDCIDTELKGVIDMAEAERVGDFTGKKREAFDSVNFNEMKQKAADETDPDLRLMLWLYSSLPPLRGNEYRQTKVVASKAKATDDAQNYIALKDKLLIVNNSKTSKSHGAKEVELPDEIIREVKRYVNEKKTDVLFDDFNSVRFTKFLQKNLGYSVQALRKRFVSENFKHMTPAERVKLAKIMGHTIQTAMLDYNKPITDDNSD